MLQSIWNIFFAEQQQTPKELKLINFTDIKQNEVKNNEGVYSVGSGEFYELTIGPISEPNQKINAEKLVSEMSVGGVCMLSSKIYLDSKTNSHNLMITFVPYVFDCDDIHKFTNVNSDSIKINVNNKDMTIKLTCELKNNNQNHVTKKIYFLRMNIESLKLQLKDDDYEEHFNEIKDRLNKFETVLANMTPDSFDLLEIVDHSDDDTSI